jgi:signal transduction histidine kinase
MATLLVCLFAGGVSKADAAFRTHQDRAGSVFEYTSADFALPPGDAQPVLWTNHDIPLSLLWSQQVRGRPDPRTFYARLSFQGAPGQDLAIFGDFMKSGFTLYVNGQALYRSDLDADSHQFGWYRPYYVRIPSTLVRAGRNEILIRTPLTRWQTLGFGKIWLGPDRAIHDMYQRQYALNVINPQVINGVLAALSVGLLLLWLARRHEPVFGWAALIGALWWFRNLHYYIRSWPFDLDLFWSLSVDAVLLMAPATYGFAATFMDLRDRRTLIRIVVAVAIGGVALRHAFVANNLDDLPTFGILVPLTLFAFYKIIQGCVQHPAPVNLLMLVAVAVGNLAGFHDLLMIKNIYPGAGFYLMPYGSLLIFLVFASALGRRMVAALLTVETMNQTLTVKIAEVTRSLAESERQRTVLQVERAIDGERERLMREIHDGIGSSLVTAIAVAEEQNHPANAIVTLKRALTELKITVDSLEPIQGDLVALLANLRHRMEPDLAAAGVRCRWSVGDCRYQPWLDATNSLHALRIFQEAIGNSLAHARATEIEIGCFDETRGGSPGVTAFVADNGRGFEQGAEAFGGKGLSNMQARASAIQGILQCLTSPGGGVRISLWLPYDR